MKAFLRRCRHPERTVFLNDGYLSATLACGSGVFPRTVRWGGTLLPQAVGRAMEWPDSCPRRKLPAHRLPHITV